MGAEGQGRAGGMGDDHEQKSLEVRVTAFVCVYVKYIYRSACDSVCVCICKINKHKFKNNLIHFLCCAIHKAGIKKGWSSLCKVELKQGTSLGEERTLNMKISARNWKETGGLEKRGWELERVRNPHLFPMWEVGSDRRIVTASG